MDEKTRSVGKKDRTSGRADEDVQGYSREIERRPTDSDYLAPPEYADTPSVPRSAEADDIDTTRTREIRAEIEQTRDNLSETIEAIQDRLRPSNLVSQATDSVKTATTEKVKQMANTAGETASQVAGQTRDAAEYVYEGARQNPIPAAMIGIGAAWLLMNRSGSDTSQRPRYVNTRGEITGDNGGFVDRIKNNPVPSVLAGIGLAWLAFSANRTSDSSNYGARDARSRDWRSDEYYRSRSEGYAGTGYSAYDRGSAYSRDASFETGAGAGDMTNRVTESAREYARDAASTAREYGREAADTVRYTTRRAQNQFQRLMRENPLLVGAAAAVIGAAVGAALPETDVENEWMGDARDTVIERAQDMARDAADKVQEEASSIADVAGSVKDTVQNKKP